jgi:hypothetical protein
MMVEENRIAKPTHRRTPSDDLNLILCLNQRCDSRETSCTPDKVQAHRFHALLLATIRDLLVQHLV